MFLLLLCLCNAFLPYICFTPCKTKSAYMLLYALLFSNATSNHVKMWSVLPFQYFASSLIRANESIIGSACTGSATGCSCIAGVAIP